MDLKDLKQKLAAKAAEAVEKHRPLIAKAEELARTAKEAAAQAQEKLLGPYLRLDRSSRVLSISDDALLPGLRKIASLKAAEADVTIDPTESGLKVSALVKGKRVSALLELKRVSYIAGEVEVEVTTPEGAAMEGRPVAQLLAGLIARLFGGTWLGLKLLSAGLPSQLEWDGRTARLKTDLDAKGGVPPELLCLSAVARVTRADGWTHFAFDARGALDMILKYLFRKLAELLFP